VLDPAYTYFQGHPDHKSILLDFYGVVCPVPDLGTICLAAATVLRRSRLLCANNLALAELTVLDTLLD
jgi:hypothetical protein